MNGSFIWSNAVNKWEIHQSWVPFLWPEASLMVVTLSANPGKSHTARRLCAGPLAVLSGSSWGPRPQLWWEDVGKCCGTQLQNLFQELATIHLAYWKKHQKKIRIDLFGSVFGCCYQDWIVVQYLYHWVFPCLSQHPRCCPSRVGLAFRDGEEWKTIHPGTTGRHLACWIVFFSKISY